MMALAVYTSLTLCFILLSKANAEICTEPWILERNSTSPIFIGFTNGTFPGRYMSLLWRWAGTGLKGEWESTLWKSLESDNLLGSMAFRDEDTKVPASLMWRYQSGNLTWLANSNPLLDVNWSIKVCNMPAWSYDADEFGNWTFSLGNIKLEGLEGERMLYDIQEIMSADSENSIRFNRKKRHFIRILGDRQGNGERAWEIVREILDRVFGTSDTIKEEGWISHITNFLYIIAGALGGLATNNAGESTGISSRPSASTTISPEVETLDPTELDAIKRSRSNPRSRFSMRPS